jgi:hypothetical protein
MDVDSQSGLSLRASDKNRRSENATRTILKNPLEDTASPRSGGYVTESGCSTAGAHSAD